MTKPKRFEGRTWKSAADGSATSLVLEPTSADDTHTTMWVAAPTDGPGSSLDPQQMRELATELAHRADLLDPPKRSPWRKMPTTPAGIIAEHLRVARVNMDRVWDAELAETRHRSNRICSAFEAAALMAELEQADPKRAAKVAEILAAAFEDGGSVHEWLYDWQQNHKAGKPIGFDPPATLDLEVTRG